MARLIRTDKEVEGRYEEVWLVVDEDALEQWPAGPLTIVGRDAPRTDGFERARGEATFTADLRLNGMLNTAVLRSPHASARVSRIDLTPALASPGVHAAIGPGDIPQLADDCNYQGAAVAAVCADSFAQARAAVAAIAVEWDEREPLLDPDEAVRRGSLLSEPRVRERGDYERGLAESDVVVSAEFRTSVVLHNSMETHQAVVQWLADGVEVHISTQYIWGVRAELAEALGLPADKVRVICHYMGGERLDRRVGIGRSVENATLRYDDLNAYFDQTGRPLQLAPAGNGEARLTGVVDVLGQRIEVSAAVTLSVADDALRITPRQINTGNATLNQATRLLLGQRLTLSVPLGTLPFGHQLKSAAVTTDGVQLQAEGAAIVVQP